MNCAKREILKSGFLRLYLFGAVLNIAVIYFSNSLIIHQAKTKKITTVKEVLIPGLN